MSLKPSLLQEARFDEAVARVLTNERSDWERESERARERGDQAHTVVAGEGGACSLPEVGWVIECHVCRNRGSTRW